MSIFNDGDFYIDNTNGDFYLHELGVWSLKGNIRTSNPNGPIITGDGPPPVGGTISIAVITGEGVPT